MIDLLPERKLDKQPLKPLQNGESNIALQTPVTPNNTGSELRALAARLEADFRKFGIKPFSGSEVKRVLGGIEAQFFPQATVDLTPVEHLLPAATSPKANIVQERPVQRISSTKPIKIERPEPKGKSILDMRILGLSDEEFKEEWGLNGFCEAGNGESKYESLDETKLGEMARRGDAEAFGQIYGRYNERIFNFVKRLIGDTEDAKSLTSEAFLKASKAVERLRPNPNIGPWLYMIARNLSMDELRRRSTVHFEELDPEVNIASTRIYDDPEAEAMKKETQRMVQDALDSIPPKLRMALVLREFEGLSCEEIADIIGSTRSAVKSKLYRAREEFKAVYIEMKGGAPTIKY